jgi:hypothetical protein
VPCPLRSKGDRDGAAAQYVAKGQKPKYRDVSFHHGLFRAL